ncbi:hypothetical protein [Pseudomonas putida]|uniref:hypothetical protein n=1 Tax=Pseudomonas putida TaxID=303 RepID=UPI004046EAA9
MSEQMMQDLAAPQVGDWLLRTWIAGSGNGNGGLGVTLTTAAGLISGIIISEMEFLDGTTEAVADAYNGKGESFRGLFNEFRETVQQRPTTHIHLKDAKMLTPNGMVNIGVRGLWRGELSAVIGHSLGCFDLS